MNICFISKEYPPETGWGGIGTYIYNLSHGLSRLGHRVHVISQATEFEKDYEDESVYLHRIKFIKIPVIRRVSYSYQIFKKLKSAGCKFDIIESPEWGAEGFPLSFFKKSYPLVTRLHTPLFLARQISDQKMSFRDRVIDFLEKKQTENSIGITSPSKALANIIATEWDISLSQIKIIPNGIDIEKIKSISSNLGKPKIDDYIIYIGRLEPRKGVHILAKALPGVFAQYPNLKMVFIGQDAKYGDGMMREYILNINHQYKNNIIFTGFLSGIKKYSLIKYSRFIVLPSLWEAFGYTCLESMALGKAIIITKNCEFKEIIKDNQSGFIVEPGDHQALQEKIIYCLSNNDVANFVEKNAIKRIEDFDIKILARTTIKYYEELLEKSKR